MPGLTELVGQLNGLGCTVDFVHTADAVAKGIDEFLVICSKANKVINFGADQMQERGIIVPFVDATCNPNDGTGDAF